MILYCRVENKKLVIPNQQAMTEYIASLDGKFVTVEIKKTVSKRSVKQNRLWHLYVNILSQELGYEHDEMHEICKFKFLKTERVDENTGAVFEFIGSTAKLNKSEFSELCEKLIRWSAVEFGITLPIANEQLQISI